MFSSLVYNLHNKFDPKVEIDKKKKCKINDENKKIYNAKSAKKPINTCSKKFINQHPAHGIQKNTWPCVPLLNVDIFIKTKRNEHKTSITKLKSKVNNNNLWINKKSNEKHKAIIKKFDKSYHEDMYFMDFKKLHNIFKGEELNAKKCSIITNLNYNEINEPKDINGTVRPSSPVTVTNSNIIKENNDKYFINIVGGNNVKPHTINLNLGVNNNDIDDVCYTNNFPEDTIDTTKEMIKYNMRRHSEDMILCHVLLNEDFSYCNSPRWKIIELASKYGGRHQYYLTQAINMVFPIIKYGRHGDPHNTRLFCSCNGTLQWEKKNARYCSPISLSDVLQILPGRKTSIFKRSDLRRNIKNSLSSYCSNLFSENHKKSVLKDIEDMNCVLNSLSMSIVFPGRTLDLQLCSCEQRDWLVCALRTLSSYIRSQERIKIYCSTDNNTFDNKSVKTTDEKDSVSETKFTEDGSTIDKARTPTVDIDNNDKDTSLDCSDPNSILFSVPAAA